MLLTVLAALAQEPPVADPAPPEEPPEAPLAERPEELAETMPVQPVSAGAYQVVLQTSEAPPEVRVAGTAVPLADDGQGADAVAGDGIYSGEVQAPDETGTIAVFVEGEEAFADQVPLNSGERVRVVMTARGPMLSFEPAEAGESEPGQGGSQGSPPPKWTPPEGAGQGSLGQIALAAGAALVFGLLLGGWLGPAILGRRGSKLPRERAGLTLDGRTLWVCEDRQALEALISASGQTLLVRGPIDADGLLDAAEDCPGAVVLARFEELEGDLPEVLKEAPANLLLLAESEHPQASGTLRVCEGRVEVR